MIAFDVFVSYSTKDKATADAACASLEAAGIRCWIAPRDINAGADWGAAIVEAIDHCRMLVLIFSSHANEFLQIRNEVVRAVGKGVPIVPVRIEDIMPTKSLAYYMGSVHWLDAMTPPLQKHLDVVVRAARTLLEQNAQAPLQAGAPASGAAATASSMSGIGGASASRSSDRKGLARPTALALSAVLLIACCAGAFALWHRAPASEAANNVRAIRVSAPPNDQDFQRVTALAAENGFILPQYAIAVPKGDVSADALKFVGIGPARRETAASVGRP